MQLPIRHSQVPKIQSGCHGYTATEDKVGAVQHAPVPQPVTDVRALMGLVNCYGQVMKNLSTVAYPSC